jgi:hypothetical protein
VTVEAKEAAAEAAAGANDVAAGLAVAAGIAAGFAWAAGTGAGVAAVLGVASGLAWMVGNEYGDLALDPARDDYHLVSRFEPRSIDLPGEGESHPGGAVWNQFNRTHLEVADAIAALVRSYERLEGARLALRKPGADADLVARHIAAQRRAIRHNATAAHQRIRPLLELQPRVNAAWRVEAETLRSRAHATPSEARRQGAVALWTSNLPVLRQALGNDSNRLQRIQQFIEHAAVSTTDIPQTLLDERWSHAMAILERRLEVLGGKPPLTPRRHELGAAWRRR